jgi:GWxTD domain-containing protein
MKKIFLFVIAVMPIICMGQNIKALYGFRTYSSPVGNYVEINTSIDANSVSKAKLTNGLWQEETELVTIICREENTDSAIYVDKRLIKSPQVKDTNELKSISLLDMQRISLDNGNYIVFFELRDKNTTMQPIYYKDIIEMSYKKDDINVSDIMIIDKYSKAKENTIYTKSGYDIHPYMFDAISKENNTLNYYAEVYNADKAFGKDNYYAIITTIEDFSSNKKIDSIQVLKRQKAETITPIFSSIDISSLAEGSYNLVVEVRNENNILYAYKKHAFYKQSDKKKKEENVDLPSDAFVNSIPDTSLDEDIRCLSPIASDNQRDYIRKGLKKATNAEKRYFLYQFFKKENESNPNEQWNKYMKNVAYVNEKFSTPIKKGYQTDMGRVFLSYGAPDNIIDEKFGASSGLRRRGMADKAANREATDIDADGVNYLPYQMWHYNKTPFGETNRMFVFYAKQDNMREYFLLHSNAKNELRDMYWERTLSRNTLDEGVEGKAGIQFRQNHE